MPENVRSNTSSVSKATADDLNAISQWQDGIERRKITNSDARNAARIAQSIGANMRGEQYIAKRDGVSVGAMQIDTYGSERGYPLSVDYLAVHPGIILGEIPAKGIGTELMNRAMTRASELGVGLELDSSESAKAFYQKYGLKYHEGADHHYFMSAAEVKQAVTKLPTDK